MFSLKAQTSSFLIALSLGFVARASDLPLCGVRTDAPSSFLRAQSAANASALGEKKLLYIRVCYSDDATEPINADAAESLMREVRDFYQQHSYGQFSIAGTVTPLLVLPRPKAAYFPVGEDGKQTWLANLILGDAREVAQQAGYDPADYDLDMVRFNSPFLQSFANIGARGAWMVSSHPATTIHEIGHNLGLQHANRWVGPVDGDGSNIEYGDTYDVMGNASYYEIAGFHFIHKRALGWLNDSNSVRVASGGVFRVYAHDVPTKVAARTYALRIRKDDDRDYWIEKRQGYGEIFDNMRESGVLPYWDDWPGSAGRTQMIDERGTNESLPIGEALADSEAGVKIIPVEQAADRSYMDVAVVVGSSTINLLGDWLHLSGEPGRAYSIQFSTDLRSWTDLARRSSETGEAFVKVDRSNPRAFYRAVADPERR